MRQSQINDAIQQADAGLNSETNPLEPPGTSDSVRIASSFGVNHECIPIDHVTLGSLLFPEGCKPISSNETWQSLELDVNQLWLDIISRPILAAGEMVKILRRTQVGYYIGFQPLNSLFLEFGTEGLQKVPGSRADIFQNDFISMIEKRLMTRFMKKCYVGDVMGFPEEKEIEGGDQTQEEDDDSDVTFKEEMTEMKLTERLQKFVMYSIIFQSSLENTVNKMDGINAMRKYQQSIVAYDTKTPFLAMNYGTGELAQAFCRLCAVHGGTYVLRRGISALICDLKSDPIANEETPHVGILTSEHEVIGAKHIFINQGLLRNSSFESLTSSIRCQKTWRLMAILNNSIVREEHGGRVMITVPRGTIGNESSAVRIRQYDSTCNVCPKGMYVLYAETLDAEATESDLLTAVRQYVNYGEKQQGANSRDEINETQIQESTQQIGELDEINLDSMTLTSEEKPVAVWGISFCRNVGTESVNVAKGIIAVAAPENEIDCDSVIAEAEKCFRIVKPNDEFLPEQKDEESAEEI